MNIGDNIIQKIVGRNGSRFRVGRGRVWHWVGEDLRAAIIDAEVMDVVRGADAALPPDNQKPCTPAEIIDFRHRLKEALAAAGFRVS